jgi:hypothetical protein
MRVFSGSCGNNVVCSHVLTRSLMPFFIEVADYRWLAVTRKSSLLLNVQTGSGAHAPPYSVGTGVKVAGAWCWSLAFVYCWGSEWVEICLYSPSGVGRNSCIFFYIMYDVFVKLNWVATRWQQYSTHLHTNSTQNDTKQTIHFGRVRVLPRPCELYPGICLTTEEKARKNLNVKKGRCYRL